MNKLKGSEGRMRGAIAQGLRRRFLGGLDVIARRRADLGRPVVARGRGKPPTSKFATADDLVQDHFSSIGDPGHLNMDSLRDTLGLLEERPGVIVETGSSAWGLDSSRLFDAYVSSFGGEFWSVDLRVQPLLELRRKLTPNSTLVCDDSVRFLERWVSENPGRKADLVYLDSWDLDVEDPVPAAVHGLREFFAIAQALGGGSLLLIDDTPGSPEWVPAHWQREAQQYLETFDLIPGKGMLLDRYLEGRADVVKVHHRYQALYRFQ
jgi:hypothetical protein